MQDSFLVKQYGERVVLGVLDESEFQYILNLLMKGNRSVENDHIFKSITFQY